MKIEDFSDFEVEEARRGKIDQLSLFGRDTWYLPYASD